MKTKQELIQRRENRFFNLFDDAQRAEAIAEAHDEAIAHDLHEDCWRAIKGDRAAFYRLSERDQENIKVLAHIDADAENALLKLLAVASERRASEYRPDMHVLAPSKTRRWGSAK